ncbi:MAG TPA: RlmE family RNA methyltransferase [Alphaproteobacteria bacterium]|nr:RlmE family RNA methyltransferase [Alphaproteobacteria bacterium]
MSERPSGSRRRKDARLTERLKTAKGRSPSSQRWLGRQLNDPFVAEAKRKGYRARAAFKLIEIDDKFRLLRPGIRVVDLGAAPGGWTQVAVARVKPEASDGKVVGVDIQPMVPVSGAIVLHGDFLDRAAPAKVRDALGGAADVVLCDMATSATGHRETDHLRVMALAEAALVFACETLRPGGAFVAKLRQGAGEAAFVARARQSFANVRRFKPAASRAESAEVYLVATDFRASV